MREQQAELADKEKKEIQELADIKNSHKNRSEAKTTSNKSEVLGFLHSEKALKRRKNIWLNLAFFVPMIGIITCEWIARGTLGAHERDLGFFDALIQNFPSFLISYVLLALCYLLMTYLFKNHCAGVVCVGLIANVPAAVTYYKLSMRNEPFLPWDLMQVADLMGITDEVSFSIQANMVVTSVLFLVLAILGLLLLVPLPSEKKKARTYRVILSLSSLLGIVVMMVAVFLNPASTDALSIEKDMWMQDRYYRYNGVITGFLTNLQMLNIDEPEGYSSTTVESILQEVDDDALPYYETSPVLAGSAGEQTPDIIYVMAEGFWDMEALPGLTFDRELTPNLNRLAEESASGYVYSPSFGGGTCDVEFEALTGFSMEYLPAGSKPFQQYITDDTFSIAWHLKSQGYETLAIHGYGERFWNRDVAYPRLGIDTFIAEEDMEDAYRRRGFISDIAMVDRIIEEQQNRSNEDNPLFIHAVTMQNHTTYSPSRYPAEDLVQITGNEAGLSEDILGQVQDCATGMTEMDAALGYLTDYLSSIDHPTIVVFWGDHLNPMSNSYGLFEDTGFIEEGDTASPKMYQTPLLIWSNMEQEQVDLGTVSAYNLSPLMLELYGLDTPTYFDFLAWQMNEYTASSKGVIFYPDGSMTREIGPEQEELLYNHSVLQYDLLFGEQYQLQETES